MTWNKNIEYWYGVIVDHFLSMGIGVTRERVGDDPDTTSRLIVQVDPAFNGDVLRIVALGISVSMLDSSLVTVDNGNEESVIVTINSKAWDEKISGARRVISDYNAKLKHGIELYDAEQAAQNNGGGEQQAEV